MEHYTLIGYSLPPFFLWAFGTTSVMGLIWSLSPKRRYSAMGLAIGSLLILLLHVPAPYAIILVIAFRQVGALVDIFVQRDQTNVQLALKAYGSLAFISILVFLSLVVTRTSKDLWISPSGLSFLNDRWGTKHVDTTQLDLIGLQDSGEIIEWDTATKKPGTKDPFIGNMFESELYWDHDGHVLSGPELGRRIASLTGAKPRLMPIRQYYDDQQTRVSATK